MSHLKYIFFLVLSLSFFLSLAQSNNNLVQDVVLPAPNAAALGKYSDIPVSHFTGVPSINIPIYTIQEGPLSLPISLNYHASGIKVAETASWVGMGWSLDAGGIITRTVLGIADERITGYVHYGNILASDFSSTDCDNLTVSVGCRDLVEGIYSGRTDSEPDIFSFNISGYSGKFFIDTDSIPHIIPQQDLKIEIEWGSEKIKGFTLIDPSGIEYIFGNIPGNTDDRGVETSVPQAINPDDPYSVVTNSWYLIRVQAPDDAHGINLVYVDEFYSYNYLASCNYTTSLCAYGSSVGSTATKECEGNYNPTVGKDVIRNNINGKRLDRIETSSGIVVVDFLVDENLSREDLDPSAVNSVHSAYSLDKIQIQHNNSCVNWDFSYSYFKKSVSSNIPEEKRLQLQKLQQYSCDSSEIIPPHEFFYEGLIHSDGAQFLPSRLSSAIDHWGFYNAALLNESYSDINIPHTEVTLSDGSVFSHGASNRDTDPEEVKVGILNKIKYPTGGITEFDYEANTYFETGEKVITNNWVVLRSCGTSGSSCCSDYSECCNPVTTYETSFDSLQAIDSSSFRIELRVPPSVLDGIPDLNDPTSALSIAYQECFGTYNFDPNAPPNPSCATFGEYNIKIKVFRISDSSYVGENSHNINLNNTNQLCLDVEIPIRDLEIAQTFETGIDYRFELEVDQGLGKATLFSRYSYSDFPLTQYAGGVRVKSVKTRAKENQSEYDKSRVFEYTKENSSHSSGSLYISPKYGYAFDYVTSSIGSVINVFFQEQSIVPLGSFNGLHIGYERVIEKEEGNGLTIHEFHIEQPDLQTEYYPKPPQLAAVKNGKPKTITVRKEGEENPIQYSQTSPSNVPYTAIGGTIFKVRVFQNVCPESDFGALRSSNPNFYLTESYNPRTAPYLVQTQTNTIDEVTTSTDYGYKTERHLFPVVQKTTSSNGRIQVQRFKYPQDYPYNLTFGVNSNTTIQDLINQHIISSPIETQTWEGPDESNLKMVGGQISLYKDFSTSGEKILKPFQIHLLETDSPLGFDAVDNSTDGQGSYLNLTPTDVASRYVERANYVYDPIKGNLIEQSLVDGTPIAYKWDVNGLRPLAQVVGARYSQIQGISVDNLRSSLPGSLVTTYTYNGRLQLETITGPDGITVTYEYDTLGRLLNTKDDELKLLQSIEYHYAQ